MLTHSKICIQPLKYHRMTARRTNVNNYKALYTIPRYVCRRALSAIAQRLAKEIEYFVKAFHFEGVLHK